MQVMIIHYVILVAPFYNIFNKKKNLDKRSITNESSLIPPYIILLIQQSVGYSTPEMLTSVVKRFKGFFFFDFLFQGIQM